MKRALVTLLLGVALVGCHRKVQVKTAPAPSPAAAVTFRVTNNLAQPVIVYVTTGGSDVQAGQVAGNSTSALSVPGLATGSTVSLKARTVDGTHTYTRDDVTLTSSFTWQVP
ncbi:MAG TPA: hypothetical protein VL157_03465 [Gemmatimonadaceae bacterium]|jgi:hypothetical protein|nr:hypothetical protein [Gemmatimonadaceae bacterium]